MKLAYPLTAYFIKLSLQYLVAALPWGSGAMTPEDLKTSNSNARQFEAKKAHLAPQTRDTSCCIRNSATSITPSVPDKFQTLHDSFISFPTVI